MADSDELRFDGEVAVVTGAGGGLGREYALLLASRGASVVVNDLGSSRDGSGQTCSAADTVVQEIADRGGRAVANYDSVENGDRIVKQAVETFGRIDILINNAGILRDKSFAKMEVEDWDIIQRVHLRAVFVTTRAAWPHFRRQQYGRVVLTSSASGLFGNFGQANYSAAKLGLVGLAKTLSHEGSRYNIAINVLVPAATSRLTADLLPPDLQQLLRPAVVAPVVAALCHRRCPANSAVVEAAGGCAALYRWQRSAGIVVSPADSLTAETVINSWSQLADFDHLDGAARLPNSATEQMAMIADQVARAAENRRHSSHSASDDAINIQRAVATSLPTGQFAYDCQQTMLYALSVGVSLTNSDGLRFLYENHDRFCVHPMFACLFMNALPYEALANLPGFPVNLAQLLHGEHYLELKKPLPTSAEMKVKFSVVDILDKADKGAVVLLKVTAEDAITGELYAVQQASLFIVGGGGFGGAARSSHSIEPVELPNTPADQQLSFVTTPDQAALYRLTGDRNPIHIDPEMSAAVTGGPPILHGLCSLGGAVTSLLRHYAAGQPHALRRVKARFSRPFIAGDTLLIDCWLAGNSAVKFRCRSANTGAVIVSGGCLELNTPLSSL